MTIRRKRISSGLLMVLASVCDITDKGGVLV